MRRACQVVSRRGVNLLATAFVLPFCDLPFSYLPDLQCMLYYDLPSALLLLCLDPLALPAAFHGLPLPHPAAACRAAMGTANQYITTS